MIDFKVVRRINRIYFTIYKMIFLNSKKMSYRHVGSPKGGWDIPKNVVQADWICFCAGVGNDITFDLGLIENYGCTVHAFDPTPRAIDFIKTRKELPKKFTFHQIGIWNENCIKKFYVPKLSASVNYSLKNLEQTDEFIEANCKTFKTIMSELSLAKVDLLKIDIEGAEHEVIESLLNEKIIPKVMCVEFDQPTSLFSILKSMKNIRKLGFKLVNINVFDFVYVHNSLL